ncbi:hypothetical protein KUTeg_019700 [Tegillarca granosa]|uniref:Calcineurin-like phosphoesterase domain-containing protein n=1 Tax=Tegillarca granosa TaxID=220873 RepID=A0ABQ9EDA2_TEGGR|nr:hypothetical protein KUTeg_019700 [Tegillarca granosa]
MVATRTYIGVISVTILIIGIFLAETWVLSLDFDTRGRILRAQVVFIIESIMFGMSVFVWKNVSDLFHKGSKSTLTKHNRDTRWTKFNGDGQETNHNRNLQNRPVHVKIWNALLLLYLAAVHASYVSNVWFVRTEPTWFAIITYLSFAFHIQLLTAIVLLKVVSYFKKLVFKKPIQHQTTIVLSLLYAACVAFYGHYNAYYRPIAVKHVQIPIKDLPASLDGLTITHLSDIHLGVTVGRSKLREAVNIANDLNSDITVIVGDLVDGYVYQIGEAADLLTQIKSSNHEYYTMDAHNWLLKLQSLGVNVLHNSNTKIPQDDRPSIEQYSSHGMDLDRALLGCPKEQPVILLAHQPKAAKIALDSGNKIDLVLSGHTHGGQMFPLTIGAYLFNPFYVGLYKYGDHSHVYVSMGTIYWGMPVRFMTHKEIIKITLTRLSEN